MAQGEFTKQEAKHVKAAVQEMWESLTKSKRMDFFGHLNDIFLFLEAAETAASDESTVEKAG